MKLQLQVYLQSVMYNYVFDVGTYTCQAENIFVIDQSSRVLTVAKW